MCYREAFSLQQCKVRLRYSEGSFSMNRTSFLLSLLAAGSRTPCRMAHTSPSAVTQSNWRALTIVFLSCSMEPQMPSSSLDLCFPSMASEQRSFMSNQVPIPEEGAGPGLVLSRSAGQASRPRVCWVFSRTKCLAWQMSGVFKMYAKNLDVRWLDSWLFRSLHGDVSSGAQQE